MQVKTDFNWTALVYLPVPPYSYLLKVNRKRQNEKQDEIECIRLKFNLNLFWIQSSSIFC